MSRHSTNFEAATEVPVEAVEGLPAPVHDNVVTAAAPKARDIKGQLRRLLLAGAAVAALSGAVWYGWDYWTVGRFLVSTDDAYVKADNTTIAPKVSGYLTQVLVGDNEQVKAGQVLAQIDDRDFKVALDQAKADVAAAQATIVSKHAQLDVQQAVITAAKATVEVDTATKTFAGQENKRYTDLAATGYGSVQNAQAVAASARAAAIQRQAELNLGYTTITAPIDGVVGNRTLRTGQFVQAGTQLMSLVPATGAYIIANFKETQLTDVHQGQKVDVAVDMFPGKIVHGHVDSLAPASGQEFALLPPDNATGNFTKVVQRIPVKIALDSGAPIALRPGMSVIPTVETRTRAHAVAQPSGSSKIAYADSQR